MKNITSNILALAASTAIVTGMFKGIDYTVYSPQNVQGKVEEVRVTPSGLGKSWHPDWLPVPGFDGMNYHDINQCAVLTVNSRNYAVALSHGDKALPKVGDNVLLHISGLWGVRNVLEGNETRFSDGTIDLSSTAKYCTVDSITITN